jgi:ribosomal protein L24
MEKIEIKESFQLPNSDIVLEKGDVISIVETLEMRSGWLVENIRNELEPKVSYAKNTPEGPVITIQHPVERMMIQVMESSIDDVYTIIKFVKGREVERRSSVDPHSIIPVVKELYLY